MTIDTLQVAKDLEKDVTPTQAETLARVLNQRVFGDLATKRDLDELERRLRGEMQSIEKGIRTDMQSMESNIRADMQSMESRLRGEIKDLKVEMVRWIVGALIVNFFGVAGLMITLIKIVPR